MSPEETRRDETKLLDSYGMSWIGIIWVNKSRELKLIANISYYEISQRNHWLIQFPSQI